MNVGSLLVPDAQSAKSTLGPAFRLGTGLVRRTETTPLQAGKQGQQINILDLPL